jgi:hypothetical protein
MPNLHDDWIPPRFAKPLCIVLPGEREKESTINYSPSKPGPEIYILGFNPSLGDTREIYAKENQRKAQSIRELSQGRLTEDMLHNVETSYTGEVYEGLNRGLSCHSWGPTLSPATHWGNLTHALEDCFNKKIGWYSFINYLLQRENDMQYNAGGFDMQAEEVYQTYMRGISLNTTADGVYHLFGRGYNKTSYAGYAGGVSIKKTMLGNSEVIFSILYSLVARGIRMWDEVRVRELCEFYGYSPDENNRSISAKSARGALGIHTLIKEEASSTNRVALGLGLAPFWTKWKATCMVLVGGLYEELADNSLRPVKLSMSFKIYLSVHAPILSALSSAMQEMQKLLLACEQLKDYNTLPRFEGGYEGLQVALKAALRGIEPDPNPEEGSVPPLWDPSKVSSLRAEQESLGDDEQESQESRGDDEQESRGDDPNPSRRELAIPAPVVSTNNAGDANDDGKDLVALVTAQAEIGEGADDDDEEEKEESEEEELSDGEYPKATEDDDEIEINCDDNNPADRRKSYDELRTRKKLYSKDNAKACTYKGKFGFCWETAEKFASYYKKELKRKDSVSPTAGCLGLAISHVRLLPSSSPPLLSSLLLFPPYHVCRMVDLVILAASQARI